MIAPTNPARLVQGSTASPLLPPCGLAARVRAVAMTSVARATEMEVRRATTALTKTKLHQPPPMDAFSTSGPPSIMLKARSSGSTRGATRLQPSRPSRSTAPQPQHPRITSPVSRRCPRFTRPPTRVSSRLFPLFAHAWRAVTQTKRQRFEASRSSSSSRYSSLYPAVLTPRSVVDQPRSGSRFATAVPGGRPACAPPLPPPASSWSSTPAETACDRIDASRSRPRAGP